MNEIQNSKRRDEIFADALENEVSIERDVVDLAADHHLRAGVAKFGQLVEIGGQSVAIVHRLDDDHVWRRRVAIGLDRGRGAAHVLLDMGLAHAAIADGG